jgi:hypothetical protein
MSFPSIAALITNLPGGGNYPGSPGATGFGNEPPSSTYYAQNFSAISGGAKSLTFPITGPGAFRVLIAETDILGRPTNILFESEDIRLSRTNSTNLPNGGQTPLFYFGANTLGSGARWLNVKSGNRSDDFSSPIYPDGLDGESWFVSDENSFAICLIFGASPDNSCMENQLITDLLSSYGWLAQSVTLDLGFLDLVENRTYAIVWDGASIKCESGNCNPLSEPSALGATFLALGSVVLVNLMAQLNRDRRTNAHNV